MYRDRQGALHFSNARPIPATSARAPARWRLPRCSRRVDWRRTGRGARRSTRSSARRPQRHQVDAALVKAVIRAESDFVPYARSPKGALGLMQLMPATARHAQGVAASSSRKTNIEGGVRHLRLLLDRYNGNVRLALAAYNAGDGAVERHGGIPPYPETIAVPGAGPALPRAVPARALSGRRAARDRRPMTPGGSRRRLLTLRNLPNLLTLFRILLVPVLVVAPAAPRARRQRARRVHLLPRLLERLLRRLSGAPPRHHDARSASSSTRWPTS